ncbi:MAG: MOSC domain-containing protein [Deltaproteobacteria bacterium]|nr:MAG: MOSC domain-containing protein [Deltaproteobacteria bacterium]
MDGSEPKIAAICISRKRGRRKKEVDSARLFPDWGIQGDAHSGRWKRQVSLLSAESVEKMRQRGLDLAPGSFAENILTEGLDLQSLKIGDLIRIGEAELEITQIGKECHNRCSIYEQAGDCIMPREGIFARVTRGGMIRKGDPLEVLRRVPRSAKNPVIEK